MSLNVKELLIVNTECSICQLGKLITEKVAGEEEKSNKIIIFSVYSDSYEIRAIFRKLNKDSNVFIDYYDGLGLLYKKIEDQDNPIAIKSEEIL